MSPRAEDVADHAELVALAEPRPLTTAERALLEALVEPLGSAALDRQVAEAEVIAECSCGCPSVGVRAPGPAIDADQLDLAAWGVNDEGRQVAVIVHVVLGRLEELEIWAGWDGGEVRTSLPSPGSLEVRTR